MAVLQKCPDLLKDQCCSCTEACPTCSDDKNEVTCLKVKDLTHAKEEEEEEEEDPLQITHPAVNCERDVSCAFIILVDIGHGHSGLHSIYLSDSLSARTNCTVVNGLQRGAHILCN